LLKTANNLSEIRAYTDQLMGVGDVKLIAAAVAPKGWLACNGASVSTTTYSALFAKIAYTFGGSGANFTLPNISAPVANTLYIIKASEYTP
jgi:microcystin-dependent protein